MRFPILRLLLGLSAACGATALSANLFAQAVVWDRQAFGQVNACDHNGNLVTYTWPDDNNWSQAQALGDPCSTGQPFALVVAPSNWSTPNPPTNSTDDVVIGTNGGPANLDLNVVINSLTMQTNAALNLQAGSSIAANAYNFQSDGGITAIGGAGGATPVLTLFNGGIIKKSGGAGTFSLDIGLIAVVTNGTIEVDSGTLALPGAFSTYTGGGRLNVANGATLNLVPQDKYATFDGSFTSASAGIVLLNTGRLFAGAGGLTMNLPGSMFQWSGGSIVTSSGAPFTNAGVLNLSGGNIAGPYSFNASTMVQSGSGGLNMQGSSAMYNLSNALFDLQNNSAITPNSGGGDNPVIYNYGLFRKSAGTNVTVIHPNLKNYGGTVEVDTGTLMLTGAGFNYGSNTTLIVSNAAILDINGANRTTLSGQINGYGSGQVLLEGGNLSAGAGGLTMNLPGSMFQWTGGDFQVSDNSTAPFTNVGKITLSGGRTVGAGFFNAGTMVQAGAGGLTIHGVLNNLSSGLFDLQNDAPITTDVGGTFSNYGLLRKSAGTNVSMIGVQFYNQNGVIEVDAGTLSIPGDCCGVSSNATLIVSNAAALDITQGGNQNWSGLITGSGAGQVLLGGGTLASGPGGLTLNLPDSLFQWTNGTLDASSNPFTNTGIISLSGGTLLGANFFNQGTIQQIGNGGLDVAGIINNMSGAVFDLHNDAPIVDGGAIINYGLFLKSAGHSNSIVQPNFNNQAGTIEVDSGTLTLSGNGTSSNATLVVSNTATLDVTGGGNPTWSGLVTGNGSGRVLLQGGNLYVGAGGLTFNLPGSFFQWVGGTLQDSGTAPFTNIGKMTVSGGTVSGGGFYNSGTIVQTGNGGWNVHNNSTVYNLVGSTIDLQNDQPITATGGGGNAGGIINYGLFRKSAGTSNSIINPYFNNQNGVIQVDTGTLTLAGNGTSSNATLTVNGGAVLDLTGGSNPRWSGLVTGQGTGQILLQSGTLYVGTGGLTLNAPASIFQWMGGDLRSDSQSASFTNSGTMNISGGRILGNDFFNAGTMVVSGSNGFDIHGNLNNLGGGLFDLQSDAPVVEGNLNNYGLLRKSAGTNVSVINTFYNVNGSIEIDTGTIAFNSGNSDDYLQGTGAFTVKLSGTNSGQFGQLQCNNANLSGPLNVSLDTKFTPTRGDQFQVLSSANLSGVFSSLNVPQGIAVLYTNNNVLLVVTSTAPPRISSPLLSNGSLVFSVQTVNGQSYTIQRNDDLATTNWLFYTNLNGNGSLLQVVSPVNNVPRRFFRLKQP